MPPVPLAFLEARYNYFDAAGRPEVTASRVIRWERDQGAGWVHQAMYDNLVGIVLFDGADHAVGDRWRYALQTSNGAALSAARVSPVFYLGDRWNVTLVVDRGRETKSWTGLNGTSRGARRDVRLPLPQRCRGRMAAVRFEAGAETRLHGLTFAVARGARIR